MFDIAPNLTPKQRAYVERRIEGRGPSAAYRDAYGCAQASPQAVAVEASRMERHPKIAPVLANAATQAAEAAGVSREWVLRSLKETAERCMQHSPVLDADGNPTGVYTFDARGAVAAISQIAKMQGWNAPEKVEADGEMVIRIIRVKEA
jgi:hypothetical protein